MVSRSIKKRMTTSNSIDLSDEQRLEDHKNKVGVRLTRRIGHAVLAGEIPGEQLSSVCAYVLSIVDNATSSTELDERLQGLLIRWPFFADTIELSETISQNWRCLECYSLNPPKRDKCRQCGLDRNYRFLAQPKQEENTMYCPSCGKNIPVGSQFCLHCGKSTSLTKIVQTPTEWEYKTYSLTWEHGKTGWYNAFRYNEVTAKVAYWQDWQSTIMEDLQKLLDESWQPIGEIGPSCIELRYYKSYEHYSGGELIAGFVFGILLMFTFVLFFVGLAMMPQPNDKWQMIGFKVKLRRPKFATS